MLSIFIFRLSTTTDLHYGNTGYGVSSPGMQNYKDFCQKINIPKRNYLILRIGEAVGVKRCQKSSESFSIFSFKNTKRTKIGLAKMVLIFLSYFCVLLGVTRCYLVLVKEPTVGWRYHKRVSRQFPSFKLCRCSQTT